MAADAADAPIDEAMVSRLAAFVGLSITPEQMSGVTANLRRTYELAQPLMALPLAPTEELAPVWRP